jgi:cell division inhibitor SulA
VYAELWISLASLLRSYTAVHGLKGNRVATIEADDASIVAGHEKKQLELRRSHAAVSWMRENGDSGWLELTLDGRLRQTDSNGTREEEMDMAAEAWARELMREFEP